MCQFPEIFITGELPANWTKKSLIADGLEGWAYCLLGGRLPENFGDGMILIAKKVGTSSPDELSLLADKLRPTSQGTCWATEDYPLNMEWYIVFGIKVPTNSIRLADYAEKTKLEPHLASLPVLGYALAWPDGRVERWTTQLIEVEWELLSQAARELDRLRGLPHNV